MYNLQAYAHRLARFFGPSAPRLAVAVALLGGLWLTDTSSARADTAIAVDLEGLAPIGVDAAKAGISFQGRLGMPLHLPLIELTPEIGFHYAPLGDSFKLYRGIAGARVGLGEIVRVGVYAHVGFAHESFTVLTRDVSHTAFSLDGGAFLDLTFVPFINFGIHVGYGRAEGDSKNIDALQWVNAGAHVALII
jgi:hypothetical protein